MTIGEKLRQTREAKSITLHDIAEKTNISVRFLDALEKGQIEKLPGGIFTRGFVRSYASHVGLEPDDVVRQYVQEHPAIRTDEEVEDALPPPSPVPYLIAALVALVLLVGAAYYWWPSRPASPVANQLTSGPVTAALLPVVDTTPAPTATGGPPPDAGTAVDAGPASADVTAGPVTSETSTPAEPAVTSGLPLRLTLVPTGRCWVQVRADGRVRLAREVLEGERVDIEASEVLEIVAGDAGAFGYRLNGAPGRALAAAGRIGRAKITPANVAEYQGAS